MILSEIAMDWKIAAQSYEWHRALWRLFPNHPAETRKSREERRSGFLYRIERMETGRGARVLLLSDEIPVPHAEGVQVLRSTSKFDPVFQSGQLLGFRLTVNPVKTIVDVKGRKEDDPRVRGDRPKCRVPLIREEEQRAWLTRQLNGIAEPVRVEIRQEPPLYFRKMFPAHAGMNQTVGKIVPVTFEGVLKVTDGKRLAETMRNGIGPAKAFGCGLLLVRRMG